MKGIQFVVDEAGQKKADTLDLEEWGELWEDFYDILVSESRRDETRIPWTELKAELSFETAI